MHPEHLASLPQTLAGVLLAMQLNYHGTCGFRTLVAHDRHPDSPWSIVYNFVMSGMPAREVTFHMPISSKVLSSRERQGSYQY